MLRRTLLVTLLLLPASLPASAEDVPDAGPALVQPAALQAASDDASPARHHRRHHDHDDRVIIGSSLEVKPGETVGDAVVIGGSSTIGGVVEGDAVAVGGSLHLQPGAHVQGDAVSVGGALQVDDGAAVDGQRVSIAISGLEGLMGLAKHTPFGAVWTIFTTIFVVLGLISLGALFVAFIPERIARMKQTLLSRPLQSGGAGVLASLALVPATVLLVLTCIGILVIPPLALVLALVVALGLTVVAQLAGERLWGPSRFGGPFVALATGAVLLALVRLVPFLGFTVLVIATLLGVGAVMLSRCGAPLPQRAPPAVPAAGGTPPL